MGSWAQCVDDEHVEAAQKLLRGFGNLGAIGAIGEIGDAKAQDIEAAMDQADGNPGDAEKIEWAMDFHGQKFGQIRFYVGLAGKGVGEQRCNVASVSGAHKPGADAEDGIETPHIIQTENVIGVGVGENHGVDPIQPVGDGLHAQFRRGIDENILTGV